MTRCSPTVGALPTPWPLPLAWLVNIIFMTIRIFLISKNCLGTQYNFAQHQNISYEWQTLIPPLFSLPEWEAGPGLQQVCNISSCSTIATILVYWLYPCNLYNHNFWCSSPERFPFPQSLHAGPLWWGWAREPTAFVGSTMRGSLLQEVSKSFHKSRDKFSHPSCLTS